MIDTNVILTPKDPADVVEYTIDVDGLGSDSISGIAVTGTGITIAGAPAPSFTAAAFTFWVSGGTLGANATVRATITTTGGRTLARTLTIPIRTL